MALIKCPECGREVSEKATACPNCGCPIQDALERQRRHFPIIPVLIVFCLTASFIIVAAAGVHSRSPKTDFHNLRGIYEDGSTCTISEDGKSLYIDTNPNNIKEKNLSYVLSDIEDINTQLGFSSSLIVKMEETRAIDGRQEEDNGEITVSWTYHPDSGLEVLYEID